MTADERAANQGRVEPWRMVAVAEWRDCGGKVGSRGAASEKLYATRVKLAARCQFGRRHQHPCHVQTGVC